MSRKNNPPGRVRTHKGEWATTGPVGDKLKFVCFTIGSAIKIRYASLSEEESYHHYRRHRRRRAPVGRIFSNETRVVNVVQRRKNSIFVSRHTAHYYFTFSFLSRWKDEKTMTIIWPEKVNLSCSRRNTLRSAYCAKIGSHGCRLAFSLQGAAELDGDKIYRIVEIEFWVRWNVCSWTGR